LLSSYQADKPTSVEPFVGPGNINIHSGGTSPLREGMFFSDGKSDQRANGIESFITGSIVRMRQTAGNSFALW